MDIEEIKAKLGKVQSPGIEAGLLWLIERLQDQPTVQVARLEPGDVVVVQATQRLSQRACDELLRHYSDAFPNNSVIVSDDVEKVVVVRPDTLEGNDATA